MESAGLPLGRSPVWQGLNRLNSSVTPEQKITILTSKFGNKNFSWMGVVSYLNDDNVIDIIHEMLT